MKLSVVLATYNEEKNIADCLASVHNWCDEIVVVDGTSIDKTVELAKKYQAKITIVANDPMFHNMKQKAVDIASGEWILQLDADERVSEALKTEITSIIRSIDSRYNGYYIPRKNWFLGRFLTKGGVYPDYVIRLFKKGRGHFPAKSVHEQIAIDGEVGYIKEDLIHFADPTLEKYLLRFNRYSDLEANKLSLQRDRSSLKQALLYIVVKPTYWFFMRFIRHRGYVDGFQGLLFALFSALHYPVIYLKAQSLPQQSK